MATSFTSTPATSCANYHPRVVTDVTDDVTPEGCGGGGAGGSAATAVTGYVASDMNAHWNRVAVGGFS